VINFNSPELEPLVFSGELDMAVVMGDDFSDSLLESRLLMRDSIYLCVEETLLRKYCSDPDRFKKKALRGVSVEDCAALPLSFQPNRLNACIRDAFRGASIEPHVYLSCTDTQVAFSICCQGQAACFVPKTRLASRQTVIPESLNIFPLLINGGPYLQKLYLIRRKDRYLTAYGEFFIDLLTDYFANVESEKLERKV